jgi:hypothetical protein
MACYKVRKLFSHNSLWNRVIIGGKISKTNSSDRKSFPPEINLPWPKVPIVQCSLPEASEAGKRFPMWNSFHLFREGSYDYSEEKKIVTQIFQIAKFFSIWP